MGRSDEALATLVDNIAEMPQIVPRGYHSSYNNSGLATTGCVIEVVTGLPFEAAVTELVVELFGLERARFFPEAIMTRSFAAAHARANGELVAVEPWGMERVLNPAGGLSASVSDELSYVRFHLGDGRLDGTRLLSADSIERMQTPLGPEATVPSSSTQLAALGVSWLFWARGGERILSHPGGTNGQPSTFTLVPGRDFALTVLTNANTGVELDNELTDWAMDQLLGIPPERMEPVPAESQQVAGYIGSYVRSDKTDTIRVSGSADGLLLEWIVPEQPMTTVPLLLIGADQGFVEYMGLVAPVDFVRDDTGNIAWIRFLGRLVPKAA